MKSLMTIKGTALNKGQARTWIETDKLSQFGFVRGSAINVEYGNSAIIVTLDDNGRRKVAGRVRNGKAIQILDLCETTEARDNRFNGSEKLEVIACLGCIVIRKLIV
jgi:hypothetical protein